MVTKAEFYDEIYMHTPSKWNDPARDAIAFNVVKKHLKPRSIIDIGCGNGHTLKFFGDRLPDAELYGVDLSPEAVRLARQNVPDATIVCSEFNKDIDLPYCDLAVSMGTAEHFLFLSDLFKRLTRTAQHVYIEAPNCLKYSNRREEGYRETFRGAGQAEWHLRRPSWEIYLRRHFEFIERVHGTTDTTEFIWLLKSPEIHTGHPIMDAVVPVEMKT